MPVRPRGTTRLPMDIFSWNSIFEYISKLGREKASVFKIWQDGVGTEYILTFVVISRSFLLKMGNVSEKGCREYRNAHFVLNTFFRKSCHWWNNMEKIWYNPSDRIWQCKSARAQCMLDNEGYTRTVSLSLSLSVSQNMQYLLLLHRNDGYANSPQCYIYKYSSCFINSRMILSLFIRAW